MADVVERIQQIIEAFELEKTKPYKVKTELLFNNKNEDHMKLKAFWETTDNLFEGEEEKEDNIRMYHAVRISENEMKSAKPMIPSHVNARLKAIDKLESG